MKLRLSSIAGSALVLTLTAQVAHSSESNSRDRDPQLEPSKLVTHEVIRANMAMPPAQDKGVSAAAVKDSNDHMFHMDILDTDEYGDENDGALNEGDYNYDDENEDEDEDEDEKEDEDEDGNNKEDEDEDNKEDEDEDEDDGDHDDDGEDSRDVAVDLDLYKDTDGSDSSNSSPRHPSSDRGFHYADPLMAPPTDQEQCHIKHKRDQTYSEPTSIPEDPSESAATAGSDKEAQMTALVKYEPGGACIDSFVNFSLRLQERCNISCLKLLTHIFVKPDVFGLLGCFGCVNFLVSGVSAVITDCVGLFAPYPNSTSTTTMPVPTGTVKKISLAAQGDLDSASLLTALHPNDQGLGTLDFKQVIHSLQNLDMNQVQEWLDTGKKIIESKAPVANQSQKVESESANASKLEQEEGPEDEEANQKKKDMFNNFIIQAASFANWPVTPAMLEATGVYDRFHSAGIL
ncbi:hypothetical protein BGZ67_006418 [Mortierella alpina]|nr:hypothetical protein BGZ67_006418 [Mortierella alpina]